MDYDYYSSVTPREVEWLWYPYIPYGKITLLQGDPGEGKSTFVINLIAVLTRGGILPDGAEVVTPNTVIYQCAEDNIEDTVKPRLVSAGADCKRVAFIIENDSNITLTDVRIENAIKSTQAKLLVLDPIQAFISADSDMLNAIKMRYMMRELANMAAKYNCAVLLVGHLNKATGGKNLYRGLGSIDIAAVARSILMIEHDMHNPEIRYMFSVKSSLAPISTAISFVLDSQIGFRWIGRCRGRLSKDDIMIKPLSNKKDRAAKYLKIILSECDMPSKNVFNKMSELGISERTVRKAQKEVGVKAYKKHKEWYLHLEDKE